MPYILNTYKETEEMLRAIGVSSIEDLYSQIPKDLRLKAALNIPSGLSELDTKRTVKGLAEKNIPIDEFNSFLGAGCYDHYIPAALEFIVSQSQLLTAYTPYQAECSQGILQAIYEYQSYICLLTGMDASNASLLDGASSLAEAVLMSLRVTKRNKIVVPSNLHPEYRKTLETYLSGFDFVVKDLELGDDGLVNLEGAKAVIDQDTACCIIQSPNFFGLIEKVEDLAALAKENGAMTIMVTNPLSLAIFKEPSNLGVDIICGDGQPLGGSLNFGGPSFGFLATKNEYIRQLPGRIVGKTKDAQGECAYCLTLQTREQHIRREKATSNICSNQSLNAIAAAVYLSLVGRDGLYDTALYSFSNTQYLYKRLKEVRGINIPYSQSVFNEFVWEVDNSEIILAKLYHKGVIAGYQIGKIFPQHKDRILSCCTEKKTKDDIDQFIYFLAEILHG
ncbi:MAG: aminomethyl-transferring glycine dehydrogenase subunit GcvPA [Candidatus Omnitrophica bacterium]|nr:aminomethyl-transferring glycine dehydrogenase subunit GcvPA [Candidatus Omnitrophota bacterium]